MFKRALNCVMLLCVVLLSSCSARGGHGVGDHPADELNRMAHVWRYRNLDSAAYYATKAYEESERYVHGRTMACNMLGFVAFMRMDYKEALLWYAEVEERSGCELERLVADVGQMNVHLRTANNLEFYNCRVRAEGRLRHINEEVETLLPAERSRLEATVDDMHMVIALHHYMIGQRPEAHAEMSCVVGGDEVLQTDSAQWLMYTYLKGLGLDVEGDTREQRLLRRYTYLNNCLRVSRIGGYGYFTGLASSGLSELLSDSVRLDYIARQRPNSFAQLGDSVGASVGLSMAFVSDAISCLRNYGDNYGVANAMVQMASLYNREGNYVTALDTLQQVLDFISGIYSSTYLPSDSVVKPLLYDADAIAPVEVEWLSGFERHSIPDALSRLREEASLSFAGLGDKLASDYNRNIYLDLLEMTRQNKELESRYLSLKNQRRTMNVLLAAAFSGMLLFVLLVVLLGKLNRRRGGGIAQQLRNTVEEAEKRVYLHQKHAEKYKRDNVVRKASFSMVMGIMPYIDRMAHEVERLQQPEVWNDEELRSRKLGYINELTEEINSLNEVLSQWIKTTQGVVSLHIETFALSEVLGMIECGASSFEQRGIALEVRSTDAVVKADKALTFFMLNTLADNARKFTPVGGRVIVKAESCDGYVELSVSDNGVGMSAEDVAHILNEKVYDAASIGHDLPAEQRKNKGSGFGLLNCKGIIEKYRKTDPFFEVCAIGVDSKVGEGSRFWFRLPKSIRTLFSLLCLIMSTSVWASPVLEEQSIVVQQDACPDADGDAGGYDILLSRASSYADSVYFANVDGRYNDALRYGDSAIAYLNAHHRECAEGYIGELASRKNSESDVEVRWWLSDYATDYHTILDVRNELAVANLALRRWDDYRYNNLIYNELYRLVSEDRSLADYCNRMQRYNSGISVAILFCLLLAVGYLGVILYTFFRKVNTAYRDMESVEDDERRARHEENRLHVQNMVLDNCLSTIKHETAYYPYRIKRLASRLEQHDERVQMNELTSYYKMVFSTLAECASRQLGEATFRRSFVEVNNLLQYATSYYTKQCGRELPTSAASCESVSVLCDTSLVYYLLELLVDASLSVGGSDNLALEVKADGGFVRFMLCNASRTLSPDKLRLLFSPVSQIDNVQGGHMQGAEYIVARQIIREHDDNLDHVGCRINAESTADGFMVWFTLPMRKC